MPNQLVNENSPYLLQHASNPVDWHPWNEAALQKARQEDKPIFLSIGYSACHWCHVMAHESFEDPQTAALLNDHFVCIKVDREERPDLDSIYMSATQALTGSGGWPMSVFLTPGLQPFFAGTYFPPVRRGGLPAFREILSHLAEAWRERRSEVERVGLEVLQHLRAASLAGEQGGMPGPAALEEAAASLLQAYDWQHGGWGGAPRFPQPMALEFLLRRLVTPGTRQEQALRAVCHALDAMSRGGMYDVVGGGFSRYSVDDHWHIPHFEKMLPDNAQLARLYLHAALLTGEAGYRLVCTRTLDFILREMTGPRGEFHSSLDADSEGREGQYYVWTWSELRDLLGPGFDLFQAAYGLTPGGNWEGQTVLQRSLDDATLASEMKITAGEVASRLGSCHARLLEARQARPRPAVDDKVLVSWNALALSAFARAARHLGRADYLQAAVRNARFLLDNLFGQGRLLRSWRQGRALHPAGLEDYAGLVLALLDLYQSHPAPEWYLTACQLAGTMIARFSDPQGGFFDTDEQHEPLPLRPKEIQDNALPSGNSLAAAALLHLAAYGDHPEYRDLAVEGIARLAGMARRYPLAFGHWLSAADFAAGSLRQVAVLGFPGMEGGEGLLDVLWSTYRPDMVAAIAPFPPPPGSPQLLRDRPLLGGKPTAYVCRDSVCAQPVNSPDGLAMQLRS